jgi:hypothetical protein
VSAFRDSGRTGASAVSNIRPNELPGYQPEVRRRDQGWPFLVPIYQLDEQQGAPYSGQSFRQFLPPEIVSAAQTTDLPADIDGVFEGRSQEISCDLGDDWQFDRIEAKANRFVGHAFRGRVIKSLAHQLAMIAYDLEKALLEIPNLSVYTIAAFFTSWPVWRHIVDWAPRVEREMIQQKHPMIVQIDERAAVQFLHRQMWAYAEEVKTLSGWDAIRAKQESEMRVDDASPTATDHPSGVGSQKCALPEVPTPAKDEVLALVEPVQAGTTSADAPVHLEPSTAASGGSMTEPSPEPTSADGEPAPIVGGGNCDVDAGEAGTRHSRRYGFEADMRGHNAIAKAVSRHDPRWRMGSKAWRAALEGICKDLDSEGIDIPGQWKTGTTLSLKSTELKSWFDALDLGFKKLVIDRIRYSLKMVLKRSNGAGPES